MAEAKRAVKLATRESAPKLGRPRSIDAGEIDRKILEAATELFLRRGFAETTMENVATSARISKATLYVNYPSKELLFCAVVSARSKEWVKRETAIKHPSVMEMPVVLSHYATILIETLATDEVSRIEQLILAVTAIRPNLKRTLQAAIGYQRLITLITEQIRQCGIVEGKPVADPKSIAEILCAMIYGWYHHEERVRRVTKKNRAEYVKKCVNILMRSREEW